VRIEYLTDREGDRWDAYVGARTSSVLDLFAWRLVARDAYGIGAHHLVAVDDERIVGALALFELRHPLFGHYLVSAVFGTDGGLLYDREDVRDALTEEASHLSQRQRAGYLLIRTRDAALPGFRADDRFRTAVVDLSPGTEEVWERLPGKTRNQVRRGMKEGFTVARGVDQISAFHDVFHRHMRLLGSPAHSVRFYEAIARHVGERADFLVVRDGNTLVAGALMFHVNGTAMNLHTVALPQYNTRCPNYLLYWRMMEIAAGYGCHAMDMGRSEAGSSQLRFKENWAPQTVQLFYNYRLPPEQPLPRLDPRNSRYALAISAWRRLPLPFTKLLGPQLITGLG
jgi:FemAB-related protein (PEP-CTERM system-associated)